MVNFANAIKRWAADHGRQGQGEVKGAVCVPGQQQLTQPRHRIAVVRLVRRPRPSVLMVLMCGLLWPLVGCERGADAASELIRPQVEWLYMCFNRGPVTTNDCPSQLLARDAQGEWGWIPAKELMAFRGTAVALDSADQPDLGRSGVYEHGERIGPLREELPESVRWPVRPLVLLDGHGHGEGIMIRVDGAGRLVALSVGEGSAVAATRLLTWHANGTIKYEGGQQYSNLIGYQRVWFPNGQIRLEGVVGSAYTQWNADGVEVAHPAESRLDRAIISPLIQ